VQYKATVNSRKYTTENQNWPTITIIWPMK